MIKIISITELAQKAEISTESIRQIINKGKLSAETLPDYYTRNNTVYWNEDKAKLLIDRLKRQKTLHPTIKRIY